tara:strand:- start:367 stop:780 length:414 start_codon:yes stop_codon:yes gene_type:complete
MGFKLGSETSNYAIGGEIRKKMRFSQEAGGDASVPGTPVIRKNLDPGIMGEANMDGSIFISNKIVPGSFEERQVINHEMVHATQMRTGKLEYGDDFVKYDGTTYIRKTINGKDMIKIDGKWTEAGGDFPWEKDANYG